MTQTKKILISTDFIASIFHSGPQEFFIKNGIPDDAVVVDSSVAIKGTLQLTLKSEKFYPGDDKEYIDDMKILPKAQ